jgi:CP family cyanate transporter-like MFS transporter
MTEPAQADVRSAKAVATEHLSGSTWQHLLLLWLAGNCLRLSMLAVPPLLPTIHRVLGLNETAVGALTGLPVLLMAGAAVPGSLLIARIGARRALLVGFSTVALAGAARGLGLSAVVLFAMTFLMGLGVAVAQPALPSLVRLWFPRRIGLATAVYSNGLVVGEIVAVSLTAPLILPLVGGWPWALAVWSIPVALTVALLALFSPQLPAMAVATSARWWPNWSDPLTWRVGLILGCASTMYFNANAFIPDYLKATHHPDLINPSLTSLNALQVIASFLVLAFPGRLVGRREPFIVIGLLTLVALAGFLTLPGFAAVIAISFVGFCSAMGLILNLALPPLIAAPDDVHRFSAAIFAISYSCAFITSLIGGAVWDATGIPATAFTLVAVSGATMVILARGLSLPGLRTT